MLFRSSQSWVSNSGSKKNSNKSSSKRSRSVVSAKTDNSQKEQKRKTSDGGGGKKSDGAITSPKSSDESVDVVLPVVSPSPSDDEDVAAAEAKVEGLANGGSASSPSAVHLRPLLMAPGSNGKATSGRLPTSDELMKELCKINPSTNTSLANDVEERYYSHEESLRAMRNIITWAESYDREFFENVYEFGCVPKVA